MMSADNMTATDDWKEFYQLAKHDAEKYVHRVSESHWRDRMYKVRREAALERALAAALRRAERAEAELVELKTGVIKHINRTDAALDKFESHRDARIADLEAELQGYRQSVIRETAGTA